MQQPCYHTEIKLCTRMKPHLGGMAPFHWGKVQPAVILGERRNDIGTEEPEEECTDHASNVRSGNHCSTLRT